MMMLPPFPPTVATPSQVDLSQVHYLSGPIRVCDADGAPAQPGDLLEVELCDLGTLPGYEWGFTGTFDRDNGGGFLTDHFPAATKRARRAQLAGLGWARRVHAVLARDADD